MMRKRIRGGSAALLALLFAFSLIAVPKVYAATAVETDRICSVDFSIAGEFEELKSVPGGVAIELYKVASIDESGKYTAVDPFSTVDVASLENDATAADTWLDRADDASKLIAGATAEAKVNTDPDGNARIENLATGLYLVSTADVQSDYYIYDFKPYLISLPNNYYYETGSDEWIYDLTGSDTLSLKPGQTPRMGDLQIDKTLINQNITTGSRATFVFQIEIETLEGKTTRQTVGLTFEEIGTKASLITDIPAGAKVTVTEEYPGAGYRLTAASLATQTVTILADNTVHVTFENEHDGTVDGGYGIVNNFRLDENNQYEWTQLEDNAAVFN